jgi:hypothetical protein
VIEPRVTRTKQEQPSCSSPVAQRADATPYWVSSVAVRRVSLVLRSWATVRLERRVLQLVHWRKFVESIRVPSASVKGPMRGFFYSRCLLRRGREAFVRYAGRDFPARLAFFFFRLGEAIASPVSNARKICRSCVRPRAGGAPVQHHCTQ